MRSVTIFAAAILAAAGTSAAQASECVELRRLGRTTALDNQTIIAALKGRDQYRKIALAGPCGGLKFHNAFAFSAPEGRICKGQSISVIRTGTVCGIADIEGISADEAKALLAAR